MAQHLLAVGFLAQQGEVRASRWRAVVLRRRGQHRVRPGTELVPLPLRHAEQLADHGHRQRERELVQQVDGPLPLRLRGHAVGQPVRIPSIAGASARSPDR